MIGIYKITKKENGKSYIGQSNDIERRFKEHTFKNKIPIDKAIQKYGKESFQFEILEECSLDELDEKERYWINYYNTYKGFGYNCSEGGGLNFGENNGRALITESDIINIRKAYNAHKNRKETYQKYKDKITFSSFAAIWDGTTWKHVMPEVYTKENKEYYSNLTSIGEKSVNAVLSDEEVMECRKRYVSETAKDIYEDFKDKIKFQTLQQILWGRTYKHLPIYKKKTKEWINL